VQFAGAAPIEVKLKYEPAPMKLGRAALIKSRFRLAALSIDTSRHAPPPAINKRNTRDERNGNKFERAPRATRAGCISTQNLYPTIILKSL